jgi:endoglucanase
MKRLLFVLHISLFLPLLAGAQDISVNQVGYFTDQVKLATVPAGYEGYFLLINDATQEVVYTAELSSEALWSPAARSVRIADFSAFTEPGTYHIEIESTDAISNSFVISGDIYTGLSRDALRFFYLSRVSMPLLEQYAGEYARAAGHPDTSVIVHSSAASAERPAGTRISTPRGWYDAGDYNKYVVNAGISNYTVFAIAEHFPEYAANLDLNIPESNNNVPDVIDEGIYNLRWMLSMQDPYDGGVYHKCTELQFCGFITPAQAAGIPRYVVMKTTAATLDMASVASQASRILRNYESDYPGLADSCLAAAEYAYAWAQANPAIYYSQPSDVGTGSYGDGSVSDEFRWAALELYITTLNEDYLDDYSYLTGNASSPGWGSVYSLGLISLLHNEDIISPSIDMTIVKQKIITYADNFYNVYLNSAYKVPATSFYWGSNSGVANGALMAMQAYFITGNEKYREVVITAMDYLLGRNPTLYSFVTGYGSHTPMHPHDRKSASDGVLAPIPAMLVGGPNPGNTGDCGSNAYPSLHPALSYLDEVCSYSTNEIAINWNAPLAYLACGLQATQIPQPVEAFTGVTDSSRIFIQFDAEMNAASISSANFRLTLNEGEIRNIESVILSTGSLLQLNLETHISAADSNILFSYLPGDLQSVAGVWLDTIMNYPITNLVYRSAPEITEVFSHTSDPVIFIGFSKKMTNPDNYIQDFSLTVSGNEESFISGELVDEDSLMIALYTANSISYRDTLLLSYSGNNYAARDGGILKRFDTLPVANRYAMPSAFSLAELYPGGDGMMLTFSKALIDSSVHAEDFAFTRNDDSPVNITNAWLSDEDKNKIILVFEQDISMADTNLRILYSGIRLLSYQEIPVEPFGPIAIENTAKIPHAIPGSFEAEDYYRNVGYVFEECSDEGGGQNLGYAETGDYIDYYVDVDEDGLYTITYRLASSTGDSEFEVFMPLDNPVDTVSMVSTGGWQNWASLQSLVNLTAGEQLMRILTISPAFNLNWVKFEKGNTIPQEMTRNYETETGNLRIYPNPVRTGDFLNIAFFIPAEEILVIELFDISGRKLCELFSGTTKEDTDHIYTEKVDPFLKEGLYQLRIRGKEYSFRTALLVESP